MLLTVQRTTRLRKRLFQGLACALVAVGALVAGTQGTQNAVANGDTRTLSIRQMHTGERLTVTFRRNGRYDRDALKQLNWIMRDWRRDEDREMDPRLFDALWEVHRASRSSQPLHVVSAYRSPRTNEMLRQRSRGVARSSQHIEGKATDFYLPDVSATRLREIGMRLQRGGVGFYPRANTPFVHIDVGSVRHWPRMTRSQLSNLFPDGKTVHLPSDNRPLARYDEARREILAAGGVVAGEAGRQVAGVRTGGTRSLWSALFGDDEGEANADEAYAALPSGTAEMDHRYGAFSAPTIAGAREPAPAADPAPRAVAAAPAPTPAAEPAPTPPVAIAAAAPAPLPPARPTMAPTPSATERSAIAALAETAAQTAAETATQASFAPASAETTVVAALPAPRPAEFGGAGTVAQLPSREPGPRLVWTPGPDGRPADAAGAAAPTQAAAVQVALAPVPPPRFDRPVVAAATPTPPDSRPEAQPASPVVAAAFAPAPPLRAASAEAPFAAVAGALGLREGATIPTPATTASAETRQRPTPASLPQPERDALRALFAAHSLAADAPTAPRVRVASASPLQGGPSGLVAIPAAGVAVGFSRDGATLPTTFRAGPAVRRVATAN